MFIKKIIKLSLIFTLMLTIIACGATTTEVTTTIEPNTATGGYELPDLSGKNKTEIETIFANSGGVIYNFVYEQNTELGEDSFIRYGGDLTVGTIVVTGNTNPPVEIVIATPNFVLPDLTGLNQTEILGIMIRSGITFNFDLVVNNEVDDLTFAGYSGNYEIGDPISDSVSLIIYIGQNTQKLPDLSGKLKGEIEKILIEAQILYTINYIVNDLFPEDGFAGYVNYEAGDYYEGSFVTVNIYKNTFTENETSLIISKYIDGGDDTADQAIEIYNPTGTTVSLSDYHLAIYKNGSYTVTTIIELGDVDLLAGDTFLVANKASTNGDLLRKAKNDLITYDLDFDGNDVIQLRYKNNTYIDTIYQIGNKDFIMDNEIFIRKADVVKGTRSYKFNEWTAYVPDYVEVVGIHPVITPEQIEFVFTVRNFDDPLGGMDLVTLVQINDGDTASFTPGFENDERVRFLGVDTPETYPVVDDWGLEAKAYTTTILNYARNNNKKIYIQSDPDLGYTETYGRHLGLIWIDLEEDVLSIDILDSTGSVIYTEELTGVILLNYHLVKNGFSYNYYSSESQLIFNNRYLYRWFQDAQIFAEENDLGIHE
jgi:endonuclease YncB( thermonuclease family)/beta-lactam-binding protein with PASTA domain